MAHARDLLVGDILVYNTGHTAMIVRPGIMAHAPGTGEILEYREVTEPQEVRELWAFRLKTDPGNVALTAAKYATQWSKPAGAARDGATPYGEDRARALKRLQTVAKLTQTSATREFGFDALYRAVKWANRALNEGKPFSEKHGTTCCAFVTACYHAAFVSSLAKNDQINIEVTYQYLAGERVDKRSKESKSARKGTAVTAYASHGASYQEKGGFHVEVSNVGSKKKIFSIDDWIELALYGLADIELTEGQVVTAAELFTPALAYDAKFYYTADMLRNLRKTDSGWTAISVDPA